jgi:D-xylose transport system substrate-binding protein
LLLPEHTTARYETQDRPNFEKTVKALCATCTVVYENSVKVAKSYDTPDWTPAEAQTEMQQAITALGNNGFDGVYAANDGTAGGAIAAMKAAGINPATRPTTGQDAELPGIQRILAGSQYLEASRP